MVHIITVNQTAKVGKAPDALGRVPEMMDTPPILWFDERKGVANGYTLFIYSNYLKSCCKIYIKGKNTWSYYYYEP